MNRTLTFEILLAADYHVGSGHPGIGLDATLFRDADSVPAIRGTTVAALLRDGLRRLILTGALPGEPPRCHASGLPRAEADAYCGQYAPQPQPCPVCRLFGSPRRQKPWAVSSARPATLETRLQSLPAAQEWGSQRAVRARIDPRSRRAEARKLFSREEGDSRLSFRFTITSHEPRPDEAAEMALLVAAARMVRNLGAGRRRGRGACTFNLVAVDGAPADQDEWLQKFERVWLKGQALEPEDAPAGDEQQPAASAIARPGAVAGGGQPYRLRLTVRADEPLLIAQHAEAGNEFEGLEAIPGSALRGALAGRAAQHLDNGDEAARPTFAALFFQGLVRFSPLYKGEARESRLYVTVPAPLDLLVCKHHDNLNEHGALWHLAHAVSDPELAPCQRCAQAGQKATAKKAAGGYITLQPKLGQPKIGRRAEMHNRIAPESGRVDGANLFSYQPLAGGQQFVGELVCSSEAAWSALQKMAGLPALGQPFTLRLGKASRRGYGQVTAVLEADLNDKPPLWIGRPLRERVADLSAPLTLTLLSDAIVADPWGRFYTSFEKGWLKELLGVAVDIEQQYVRARTLDAFNGHLGLPRWRDLALVGGSAARLRPAEGQQWPLDKLAEIERDGLGLRRHEGFGWAAFNHPLYAHSKTLSNYYFKLNAALQPGERPDAHRFSVEGRFRARWQQTLDELRLDRCRKAQFAGAARLLWAEKHTPLDQLKERVGRLGQRDNVPLALPPKDSWFAQTGKGKEGLEQLQSALTALKSLLDNDHFSALSRELSPVGVEMLAERVAAEAQKDREAG